MIPRSSVRPSAARWQPTDRPSFTCWRRAAPPRACGPESTSPHPLQHRNLLRRRRYTMSIYSVVDPATGERLAEYPTATDVQIQEAIASAQSAFTGWARSTTVAQRAALAARAAELFSERRDRLAAIIHREMGKPQAQSEGEVEFSAEITAAYVRHAEEWLADEALPVEDGLRTFVRRQGIGVLLGIMPWNYPYYQVARFAVPNLILGNTVILKHAEQCPESALALQEIFVDAGFPEGAYVNVFATHEQVSAIIADPRVQGVSVTGSERTGAIV